MVKVFFCGFDSGNDVSSRTINVMDHISRLGENIIWHNFKRSKTLKFYNRTTGMIIQSLMQRNEYDIIHMWCSAGFGSFPSTAIGALASYRLKKMFISTYLGSKIIYRILFKICLRKADMMFLGSQLQKTLIQKYYLEAKNNTLLNRPRIRWKTNYLPYEGTTQSVTHL